MGRNVVIRSSFEYLKFSYGILKWLSSTSEKAKARNSRKSCGSYRSGKFSIELGTVFHRWVQRTGRALLRFLVAVFLFSRFRILSDRTSTDAVQRAATTSCRASLPFKANFDGMVSPWAIDSSLLSE